MSTGAANAAYATAFVDELARSGMRHACVSPGSRSTPLALALAAHPELEVWIHPDERSGAFFALGLAKASRTPVALLCTSGSAAANFYPAVIEARYSRIPLVVLTADRPPELRDSGAPQAIDQLKLYGDHVRWYAEMAIPEESAGILRYARASACRAYATAAGSPSGPVHLNFPFREPLLPAPGEDGISAAADTGRPARQPIVSVSRGRQLPEPGAVERLARELEGAERGLIVCGPQDDPRLPEQLVRLALRLGFPLLADGLSGLRAGPHDRSPVVDAYDAFLRDEPFITEHAPDLLLRFGAMPVSKPFLQYVQRYPECRQVVVDEAEGWRDPAMLASEMVYADPVLLCETLLGRLGERAGRGTRWAAGWTEANTRTRRTLEERLAALEERFEGKVFSELARLLPDGATLYVGNSMPVRDLDTFFSSSDRAVRVLCNRGANGIDGVISSALGASVVSDGPLVLAIGDLSFYHDMNGLLAAKLYDLDATIVLLNNDGGGIFSFLPQAAHPEHFEPLFGTPHGLDLGIAVRLYGGEHVPARKWPEFRQALRRGMGSGGLTVVELRTDRERNVVLHREMWAAVSEALGGRPAPRAVATTAAGPE